MPCTPPNSRPLIPPGIRPFFRVPNGARNFLNPTPGRPNNGARFFSPRPNNANVCTAGARLATIRSATVRFVSVYRPDDDVRIRVNGVTVYNPLGKNLGSISWPAPTISILGTVKGGDFVQVDTFDGWGGVHVGSICWRNQPWLATVQWSDGWTQIVTGGNSDFGDSPGHVSTGGDYYTTNIPHYFEYHDNGSFTVLPHPTL